MATAVGERSGASHYDGVLIDALLKAGELDEAAAALVLTRAFLAESHEQAFASEIDRHAGRLAEARGDLATAASFYQAALDRALAQDARSYALRAATSFASLERRHGLGAVDAPGRVALSRLLATFTEGHTTADLRAAQREMTS